ncbi:hypothetical protein VNO77_22093 [Canavalia gladiata]|uniref:Uncharacterized protein n=1 Tax=Canavalia gladiata TaxID=3824 RepID=A0AAN9L5G0_CANGL
MARGDPLQLEVLKVNRGGEETLACFPSGVPRVAGVLEKLAFSGEDYKSNFCIAKNGDLVSFLEQTRPSLGKAAA